VPAAAVIRIVRVFNLMTRCIRPYRGLFPFLIKNEEQCFVLLLIPFN
jgi:hypothetical protein